MKNQTTKQTDRQTDRQKIRQTNKQTRTNKQKYKRLSKWHINDEEKAGNQVPQQVIGRYQAAPVGEDDGIFPDFRGSPARAFVVGEQPDVVGASLSLKVRQVRLQPPLQLQCHQGGLVHSDACPVEMRQKF